VQRQLILAGFDNARPRRVMIVPGEYQPPAVLRQMETSCYFSLATYHKGKN
jgi:hypothetical protein